MTGRKMPKGRPFQKGVVQNPSGRPKKTTSWKEAEDLLREALPRILKMEKNELQNLLQSNPTGAEMLAAKYIHEHIPQAVERFLGKVPNLTEVSGPKGGPLETKSTGPDLSIFTKDILLKMIKATD